MKIKAEHYTIATHEEHCLNQISTRVLSTGEIVAVYNEERFPFHHDSGQTVMTKSSDGGVTWSTPNIVLPWSETTGNWDCGICELNDRSLLVNLTIAGFFKRGIKAEQPSWKMEPWSERWGDWTWAYKTQGWLGTYVLKSNDQGETWSDPIPVNVRPLKHGGCRLGCWQLTNGSILMGLYGRIRGYGEEGEGETTRSALMRSDDGGYNWEYYSTIAYDAASIIDFEEPALLELKNGRMICFLRTHVNPSGDAKNMAYVISDDNGFSWSSPIWTNIWGYPAELIPLMDGRYLMIYGYRRPPYGVKGVISEDGLHWDEANSFFVREGGVPEKVGEERPGVLNPHNVGVYQHIGYPSVVQIPDGTVVASYHEWDDAPDPLQYVLCTRFNV